MSESHTGYAILCTRPDGTEETFYLKVEGLPKCFLDRDVAKAYSRFITGAKVVPVTITVEGEK